jgi:LmbE family N-acetylglucosaminyl deacetylase
MKALLLVPHADDETLFASHIVMRYDPDIWVVYVPRDEQERETRRMEMARAVGHLTGELVESADIPWIGGYEGEPMYSIKGQLTPYVPPESFLDRQAGGVYYDYVFAPLPEENGHDEHNRVGEVAFDLWGTSRCSLYPTYTRVGGRSGRSQVGQEVELSASMVVRKLRALAEYRSQIEDPARRPWFTSMLDLREWIVP